MCEYSKFFIVFFLVVYYVIVIVIISFFVVVVYFGSKKFRVRVEFVRCLISVFCVINYVVN